VVANAGGSTSLRGVLDTDPAADMLRDFEVNAVGPARLFGAVWPLLEGGGGDGDGNGKAASDDEGKKKEKRFVLVTSSLGSIATLDVESLPGVAYGMSKAAANWWAKKVSVELRGRLVVGIVHPG
jgi:NAD(P)-dependent dehydrogenase (short-subunit alcohol dehydrogenase family)